MLSSITPLGERGRNNRWSVTVAAHIVGATLGGALMGAAAGAIGTLLFAVAEPSSTALALAVAVVAIFGLAFDWGVPGLALPRWKRQVDEDWMTRYRGWVYGAGYGVQLGMGVVTIVTTTSVYGVFVLAGLTGTVATGALVGATFGLTRGLTVLVVARVDDPATLRATHRRINESAPWGQRLVLAGQALVAAGALAALAI